MTRLLPIVLALFAVPVAQAGPMWGYRSPTNTNVLTPGSAAGLTFPNTSWTDADGGGSIVITPVQQWSVAAATDPDTAAGDYTFGLEVIDYESGMSGVLDFAGTVDGKIWKDGANLTNTFTERLPSPFLDLGDYRYTVALDAFESPTGFGEAGAGKITAAVTITALGDDPDPPPSPPVDEPDPPTAQTPEPATAVMGVFGLGAVALARLRRRKSVAVA